MASNQHNRQNAKPKIPGGVVPANTPVNPETLEEHIPDDAPLEMVESIAEHSTALNLAREQVIDAIVATDPDLNPTAAISSTVANKDEVIKTLTAELADAKARLVDIRTVVNNPYHVVGYLLTRAPVVEILDRPRVATTAV